MSRGLVVSLLVSIALVGGALWQRGSQSNTVTYNVESVETGEEVSYEDFLNDFIDIKNEDNTSNKPITGTDLVARQLVSDYVSLAGEGQANQGNVEALINNHVDSIPEFSKPTAITIGEIKIVSDSRINIKIYSDTMTIIHEDYAGVLNQANNGIKFTTLGAEQYAFFNTFASAYRNTANKIKVIPVPQSIAKHHVDLINNYLTNAAAMETIAKAESDPAAGLSGLSALSTSMQEMEAIVLKIEQILASNGI